MCDYLQYNTFPSSTSTTLDYKGNYETYPPVKEWSYYPPSKHLLDKTILLLKQANVVTKNYSFDLLKIKLINYSDYNLDIQKTTITLEDDTTQERYRLYADGGLLDEFYIAPSYTKLIWTVKIIRKKTLHLSIWELNVKEILNRDYPIY